MLSLHPQQVSAQQSPVSAQVDRSVIALNQTVDFIITVAGGNSARPSLPALDGLTIVGTSSASQTNIVGGQISSQVSYRYTLQPTREGETTIPQVAVVVDGQLYTTEPITVQITAAATSAGNGSSGQPGSAAPSNAAGNDIFIEAAIDNPNPYLGEQITYFFRLYQAVSLFDTPEYDAPDFSGFWNQQEVDQQGYAEQVNSRGYRVTELRTILFPTVIGEQVIEPAMLTIPSSLFQRGMSLQTEPISVNVKPLPEPIPADFSGAVGQYSLSAMAQTEAGESGNLLSVQVDEPVTLRVTLEGAGNLENSGEVALPELANWRAFDSTSQTDTSVVNGQMQGKLVVEQLLVPNKPGDYEIPAIPYTYFDPKSNAYQSTTTSPILVKVDGEALPVAPSSSGQLLQVPGAVQLIDTDIRYIKAVPASLSTQSRPFTQRPLFWVIWLLPLAFMVGDWQLRQRQAALVANPVAMRRSRALQEAQRQLRAAKTKKEDPAGSASQVLLNYLSDKLTTPVAGYTHNELKARLSEVGVNEILAGRVWGLLSFSEMSRFAPGSGGSNPEMIFKEAEAILNELEGVL